MTSGSWRRSSWTPGGASSAPHRLPHSLGEVFERLGERLPQPLDLGRPVLVGLASHLLLEERRELELQVLRLGARLRLLRQRPLHLFEVARESRRLFVETFGALAE